MTGLGDSSAETQRRRNRQNGDPAHIAIVGAGMAGAMAGRMLADQGHHVVLFDKGRGVGGRMATRFSRKAPLDQTFDHGAQYFTARDPRFRRQTEAWVSDGVCTPWQAGIARQTGQKRGLASAEDRFVGAPGMSAVLQHLIADMDIRTGLRVTAITKHAAGWSVQTDGGQDRPDNDLKTDGAKGAIFDAVIVAVPAHQAISLLAASARLAAAAETAAMAPCWTLMATLADARLPDLDGRPVSALMIDDDDCLAWIADNSSKPERTSSGSTQTAGMSNWVLQASAAWSERHLEDDAAAVRQAMLSAAQPLLGLSHATVSSPPFATAHRWRFAKVTTPVGQDCLFDPESGIGACGDWCLGPRIEAAYLSGLAMADRMHVWLESAGAR